MYVRTYIHTYIHTHTHIHTVHTYIQYIHTYTRTYKHLCATSMLKVFRYVNEFALISELSDKIYYLASELYTMMFYT